MLRSLSIALALSLALGCGASGSTGPRVPTGATDLEPVAFLFDAASARIEVLRPPDRTLEDLNAARGDARGDARRAVLRDLARAHVIAARNTEGREARRHRDDAERFGTSAAEGTHDDTLTAEMDFLEVWVSYETGARNAAARAERFTNRHETAGEMLLAAWMIRGELALTAEDWSDARDAFRFALGRLDHPLYGYALFRTAFAWHEEGDDAQARQALLEVATLGCTGDDAATLRVALLSARQLDVGARRDPAGTLRPGSCPETTTATEEEEGAWRPPE